MPVNSALAGLVLRGGCLFEHVTNSSRRGIGDAKLLAFVIARGRDKGKLHRIGSPLNIGPLTPSALQVVAQRRAVLIWWQLESDHARSVDFDYDSLDHGHYFVAG